MAATRWTLVRAALATVLVAAPALGQSASVSLTHTVTVTVPPRVKVQLASAPEERAVSISPTAGRALAISVSATQSWALSIASRDGHSGLQWSIGKGGGFSNLVQRPTTVATGEISQTPAASTLFLRNAEKRSGLDGLGESEAVVLTMVAP